MHLRFRYSVRGGHVHVRVFESLAPSESMAKSGDLTFTLRVWEATKPRLERLGWECLDETPETPSR